jgi:hypothetical protein
LICYDSITSYFYSYLFFSFNIPKEIIFIAGTLFDSCCACEKEGGDKIDNQTYVNRLAL